MQVEFVIPLKKEELLKESRDHYFVRDLSDISKCLEKLDDIKLAVNGDFRNGCESVPTYFDVLFSMLYDSNKVSPLELQELFDGIMYKLLQQTVHYVEDVLNQEMPDTQVNKETVNLVKMVFYLFSMFQRTFEEKMSLKSDNLIADTRRVRAFKPKYKKQDGGISWDWNVKKKFALEVIISFLQLDIAKLWYPASAEEEFVNLIAHCCYKMFESQEINQAKYKPLRDSAARVLALLVQKHDHMMTLVPAFVQILKIRDDSAGVLVGCLVYMVQECGCSPSLVGRLLREICETVREDHLTASLPRSAATFITELVETDVSLIAPSVSNIMKYLTLDPYTMRIAILVAITELIIFSLVDKEPSCNDTKTIEYLFRALQKHIFDQNTYVRSKVSQLLSKLMSEHKIPDDKLVPIMHSVRYHITDKSCHVSKNGIHFFNVVLQNNPFANRFVMSELKATLEKKKATLSMINPEHILTREELWQTFEPQIIESLSKVMEKDEPPSTVEEMDVEDVSIDSVVLVINQLINKKGFDLAYTLIKDAEARYPNSSEIRCNIDKEGDNKLNYYVEVFKKIFFALSCKSNTIDSNDVNVQTRLYRKLEDTIEFADCINAASKDIYQMLMSKAGSEVVEAVNFFTTAFHFGLADSKKALRDMLILVKSQQPGVKDAVAQAYRIVYMMTPDTSGNVNLLQVVNRIIKLVQSVTIEQKNCLEELIQLWTKNEEISKDFIMKLWDKIFKKIPGTTEADSAAATVVLNMIAKENVQLVIDNLPILLEGLNESENFMKIQYICAMITRLSTYRVEQKCIRYTSDNKLFSLMKNILVKNFEKVELPLYNNTATAIINMIFKMCIRPEKFASALIVQLYQQLIATSSEIIDNPNAPELNMNEQLLTRFFWIYGHIMFRKWQYFDSDVFNNLKKCKDGLAPSNNPEEEDEFEADNDVAADDALYDVIVQMCDKKFFESSLDNYILNLVISICSRADGILSSNLKSMAALTLAKCMMVSHSFCENNVQLYVTLMGKSKDDIIRANLILGFADLTARFPNVVEPWTPHLYARLKDFSKLVRTNTVTVLSHLISREMVKVRGQIAELSLCLEDPEPQISGRVKHLMSEIAQKGNTLYNVIPDIISRLSNPEREERVSVDTFTNIIRFIMSLVTKERQNELLVEKLCQRLNETSDDRQCQDLAFCLGELSYNDKSLRKLIECLPTIKDKLNLQMVYSSISGVFANCQKAAKPGLKEIAIEGNSKLERLISGEADQDDEHYEPMLVSVGSNMTTPMKGAGRGIQQTPKSIQGAKSSVKRRGSRTVGKKSVGKPRKVSYGSDCDSPPTFKEPRSRRCKQKVIFEESDSD